jgi:membrane-bound ClpP family serine protease
MKNERFKQICHFLVGGMLLLVAFKLFEQKKFSLSVTMLLAGILFVFAAGTVEWLEKTIGNSAKLFYLLESAMLLFAGYVYYIKLNKKMPAAGYAAAGVVYFFLFLYFLYDKDVSKKKRRKHRRRSSSSSLDNDD